MKYFVFACLFLLFSIISVPAYAQSTVPSPQCLGSCPTIAPTSINPSTVIPSGTASIAPTNSSTISSTQPNPSPIPSTVITNPSPSTAPCSTSGSSVSSQSTRGSVSAMARHHGKWHRSGSRGFLQQFIQWIWKLLQWLFQQLGIQLPNFPCGTTSSPSGTPSTAPSSGAGGGGGNGGGTISQSPSSAPGNVTPTIFGTTPAPTSGSTTSGFITASGTKLMLNGKQYKSLSFDISPLGACWSSNWSTSEMDTAFAAMPSGSLVRFFAPDDSEDSASFVQSIVKEADKYNIHLIIALADADTDNNCDTDDANGGSGKTAAYYTDAIKSGSNYENWVKSVVPPLANDPGVAIWEISNEPFHLGATLSSGLSQSTMQTYVDTAAAYIRSFDKNHLVSIAPADMDEVGGASGAEGIFKNLDVIDGHDYAWDYNNKSEVTGDFATLKTVSQSLSKPFMIDEAGVEGGSGCDGSNGLSLADRSTYLITKANDYLSTNGAGGASGGASAVDIWLYVSGGDGSGCSYENIGTSDPLMSAVKSYTMPN